MVIHLYFICFNRVLSSTKRYYCAYLISGCSLVFVHGVEIVLFLDSIDG